MSDVVTTLDYVAAVVGVFVSALVLVRQLFGDDGILSTGWNKRERAIRILRGRYPEFDAIYRRIDTYRPSRYWNLASAVATGFLPQLPLLVLSLFPSLKGPENILIWIVSSGAAVWVLSLYVASEASKFESLKLKMSALQETRLTRLRFLQGRLVLGWYNAPVIAFSASISGILSATTLSTIEIWSFNIVAAIALSVLVGLATVQSLSAIGGASYAHYKNQTAVLPKVRVSLKESAGGKSTVTGSLLAIGSECILQSDDGFVEHIDWQHLGRLSVEAVPSPSAGPS